MTAERKKKTTNKQLYKYSQFKSFSSRLAKPETAPQIKLWLSMNFVKNFRLRLTIRLDTAWYWTWHSIVYLHGWWHPARKYLGQSDSEKRLFWSAVQLHWSWPTNASWIPRCLLDT